MLTVAAIFAVLLLILCIPWRFEARFEAACRERAVLCFWFWCRSVAIEASGWHARGFNALQKASDPDAFNDLLRIIRRIGATLDWDGTACSLRFGLDDPAQTGMLLGWMAAAKTVLPSALRKRCDIEADFGRSCFEPSGRIRVRFVPIVLAAAVIIALSQKWYNKKKKVRYA